MPFRLRTHNLRLCILSQKDELPYIELLSVDNALLVGMEYSSWEKNVQSKAPVLHFSS